jgi:hypothetical protein
LVLGEVGYGRGDVSGAEFVGVRVGVPSPGPAWCRSPYLGVRVMVRWALLVDGLALGKRVLFPDGVMRYVVSVEREDGSGQSWNVVAYPGDGKPRERLYVRTDDVAAGSCRVVG